MGFTLLELHRNLIKKVGFNIVSLFAKSICVAVFKPAGAALHLPRKLRWKIKEDTFLCLDYKDVDPGGTDGTMRLPGKLEIFDPIIPLRALGRVILWWLS